MVVCTHHTKFNPWLCGNAEHQQKDSSLRYNIWVIKYCQQQQLFLSISIQKLTEGASNLLKRFKSLPDSI
jgi:hypothetical protein